jgi:hypothetical protein
MLRWLTRRPLWGGIAVLIATTGIVMAAAHAWDRPSNEEEIVAWVDETPVHKGEFERALRANKSRVVDEYYVTYGAEQTAAFWTTAYGGVTPSESVRKLALETVVKLKVEQMIAQEQGILSDIGYSGFLRELESENRRRQEAAAEGRVVYGPVRYEETAYLEYVMSNAIRDVKSRLLEQEWKPDERELRQFYELNKSELYASRGSVKVNQLSAAFLDSNQEADETLKRQARERMDEATALAAAGTGFAEIADRLGVEIRLEERTVNEGNVRMNLRSPVAQIAQHLAPGETSGVIEENGRFYLLQRLDERREGSEFADFAEIKDQVLKDYADYRYAEYVRGRISAAEIRIDEAKYKTSWK